MSTHDTSSAQTGIERLLAIMAALRTPDTGCPWDLEQSFKTIAPYTIEEAYEVFAAIADNDMDELKLELGDLLLQVVFHARMAEEEKLFDFNDVAHAISDKMIRRHPHVFAEASAQDATEVKATWEEIKAQEKAEKTSRTSISILDDVPPALPALMRAVKLQKRAARVGFDWPAVDHVLKKAEEEWQELRDAMAQAHSAQTPDQDQNQGHDHMASVMEELGDLLFVFANLARHMDFCPEDALRQTNNKFTRRFQWIETWLAEQGRSPADSTLEEMDILWDRAKHNEKR